MSRIGKIFSGIQIWHETCRIPGRLGDLIKVQIDLMSLNCILVTKDKPIAFALTCSNQEVVCQKQAI